MTTEILSASLIVDTGIMVNVPIGDYQDGELPTSPSTAGASK
jgi:hypothetical protein